MIKRIKEIISEISGIDTSFITNDMHLKDDLYMDSNDLDEVLSSIEDELDITLDDLEVDLVYVSDLIAYVKESL